VTSRLLQRVTVIVALGLSIPLGPARGQEVAASLSQVRADYGAASEAYNAAVAAMAAQAQRYQAMSDRVNEVRRSGAESELQAAMARFYTESQELRALERRVRATRDTMEEVRGTFLVALDRRREELEGELNSASTPDEENRVRALLVDLDFQYQELELAPADFLDEEVILYADVRFDPRDGPLEWAANATLLERKAAEWEASLQELDEEIARLQARLRLRRSGESLSTGTDRFDATRLPTGLNRSTSTRPGEVAADSASALQRLPLDQRIEALLETRAQLLEYIGQLRDRARAFRALLGRTS